MLPWSSILRPELAELTPYLPADPPGIRVRLDANEAPILPTSRLHEIVAAAIAQTALERYPDARARVLKARIAEQTGARPEELIVGAGSDELIALLLTALARPRERASQAVVLAPTPTFVMYRVTSRAHGLKPVEVPLDPDWDLDVAAMKRAIDMTRPNIVFVASPNNPTGNRMSDARLVQLLEAARDAFVVVDEAYVDYAGESVRGWRSRFPHLGILRTLSKVGLAALRVGWLEADEGLVAEIDKARQPYNVSAASQAAAAAVLVAGWGEVRANVAAVVAERERVAVAVRGIGCGVTTSQANFLWVRTPRPAGDVYAGLVASGVLVKSFHAIGGRLGHQLRVTIGTPEENDRLIEALAKSALPR